MACTVYVSLFQPSLCSASVPVSRQSRSLHLLNPFFQGRNAFSTGRRHQHVISADIGVAEDLEQKHKLKIEPYIHNMWYITYYKINMYIYIHILCICWSIYNSAYVYLSINSHMQSYNHLHNYYLVIHIYIYSVYLTKPSTHVHFPRQWQKQSHPPPGHTTGLDGGTCGLAISKNWVPLGPQIAGYFARIWLH